MHCAVGNDPKQNNDGASIFMPIFNNSHSKIKEEKSMAFINQAVTVLQTLVVALGAGLAVWGVVNLMEGYGNDNPARRVRASSS
jgi:peptidoglycan biosynthesis protein MviN/MurJ (putative lipid II flippase)